MSSKTKLLSLLLLIGYGLSLSSAESSKKIWSTPKQADSYTTLWAAIKAGKPTKIVHIGDSHIFSGFTTAPITQQLQEKYGDQVSVEYWGICGATYVTYTAEQEIDRIIRANPDMLIISLGTNDSYTFRFSAETFRANMNTFFSMIEQRLPDLPIVLTTPPPSYLRSARRVSGSRKRRVIQYTYNKNTHIAVRTMNYIAQTRGYALIDLNATLGSEQATKLWLSKGWMHQDRTHYTVPGYTRHGETIAAALIEMIDAATIPTNISPL